MREAGVTLQHLKDAMKVLAREGDETVAGLNGMLSDKKINALLDGRDFVRSVAQLGNRLHVLVEPSLDTPSERIAELLSTAGVEAEITISDANLEDVFVAATQFGSGPAGR